MDDVERMRRAMALAAEVRTATAPNPWVGCIVVPAGPGSGDSGRSGRLADGADALPEVFEGATSPPGGPHAELTALAVAGEQARGATLYATPASTMASVQGGVRPWWAHGSRVA